MKVIELIEKLKLLEQETMVVVHGYEGGFNDVEEIEDLVLDLNVNDEWYYGRHDLAKEKGVKAYLL